MTFKYDKENEKIILQESTRIEYHQLQLWLTRKVKGWKFNPKVKMGIWDGNISYFENGRVPLGLWKECLISANEINVPFKITNKEDFPVDRGITYEDVSNFCLDFFKGHKIKDEKTGEWKPFMPHDYQINTAFKILKNKFCIGEVATSGGKSLIISIVFFYILKNIDPNFKFLLIVPSISLVTQFYENLIEYNYGANNLEEIRDKKIDFVLGNKDFLPCDLRIEEIMSESPRKWTGTKDANIYIGTYQSLINWPKEWFPQFNCVVVDEAHQAKASSLQKIMGRTFGHAQYRFGVSGTFPNDDTCEILTIQACTGPKVSQIEASLLVEKGSITPMNIKALLLNYNEVELNNKLKRARGPNNGRELYEYEKKFIQKSEKKQNFIQKLVEKKCDGNTLILFHSIEYGLEVFEKVKQIIGKDVHYIDGEVSGKKRKEIFDKMGGVNQVLVASYGTLSTGVSINSIEYVIFADSFKSESLIIQSIGRSLRKFDGKKMATIYDLVDVLDINQKNNSFYRQFTERKSFYEKRKYPFEITTINL